MTRRITETFHGPDMPDVWVKVDNVEYPGEIRARAVDGDPATNQGDDWWFLVQWRRLSGQNLLDWFPTGRVRMVAGPSDEDGRMATNVVQLSQRQTKLLM